MYQLKPINSTQHGVFFAGVFLREAGDLEREVKIITRANILLERQCQAIEGLTHRKYRAALALVEASHNERSLREFESCTK